MPTIILVRVSMRLSFDDTESSFKEAAGSLRFNNTPSDLNTSTTSSMPPQLLVGPKSQERSEDSWRYDIQANYCTISMYTVTMILPNWLQLEAGEGWLGGLRIQHRLNRCCLAFGYSLDSFQAPSGRRAWCYRQSRIRMFAETDLRIPDTVISGTGTGRSFSDGPHRLIYLSRLISWSV